MMRDVKRPDQTSAASLAQDRKIRSSEQAAAWEVLLQGAEKEIRQVSKSMAALFPSDDGFHPVTVHLYQPVPIQAGDTVGHRLVDVGPKEHSLDAGLIAQVGGQTESFFETRESYKRFLPTALRITPEVVAEYCAMNSLERRTAQVAIERKRHPSVSGWPDTGPAPPLNAWIHQLPLSPLPECFSVRTSHPVIGVVYTLCSHQDVSQVSVKDLNDQEKRCVETIYQLPVYAMRCGEVALRKRIELMICRTRRALLASHLGDTANWCLAAGSLLLAHHWFFRDPVARILIYKLLAHREVPSGELEQLWTAPYVYGSSISKEAATNDSRSPKQLFEMLCSDLQQLILLISDRTEMAVDPRSHLRRAVATMLMTMTGELHRGEWDKRPWTASEEQGTINRYTARGREHKGLVLVNTLPIVAVGQEMALCLPVVSEKAVRASREVPEHLDFYVMKHLRPFVVVPERIHKGTDNSVAWSMVSNMKLSKASSIHVEHCGWSEDESRHPQRWMRWLRELVYYRSAQEHRLQTGVTGASR